jgi:hypothetical protein
MKHPVCKSDIWILPQGTIALVRPLTQRASEWVSQHVRADSQWFGPALVLENDYLASLRNRMIEDGLQITQSFQTTCFKEDCNNKQQKPPLRTGRSKFKLPRDFA